MNWPHRRIRQQDSECELRVWTVSDTCTPMKEMHALVLNAGPHRVSRLALGSALEGMLHRLDV